MKVCLAASLWEALAHKAAHPESVPVAGGTDLLVNWPEQIERHDRDYLDLSGLGELRSIRWTDDALELGALTTYWDVLQDQQVGAEFPLLHEAGRQVGAIQIQSRGTWAGNIANASPAADGVPVLMAYDAVVLLASAEETREVALSRFYRGYKQLELRSDELIIAIRLPRREYTLQRFIKVGARRAQAITKVGVAVSRSAAGWRVVANSVAPTVCRCEHVEAQLRASPCPSHEDELLAPLRQDVAPIDDIRSSAAYREHVLSRILLQALAPD